MQATPHTVNVLRVYRGASREHRQAGRGWYAQAHALAASIDPDGDATRGAGVLAALSPRTPWDRNVALARQAYADGHATGTLVRSCWAADQIMAGVDPLDALGGPKVRAFFRLIADPTCRDAVCVDRHAIDIALGQRLTGRQRESTWRLDTDARYDQFADCYRAAARTLRTTPGRVQAVTWVAWRAAHGLAT